MKPVTHLPDHYVKLASLDLSRDIGLLIKLQIAFLLSLAPSAWFFLGVTFALRPQAVELFPVTVENGFSITLSALVLLSLALALASVIIVHEAIHGLFFYLFTSRRPRFGFKFLYAYAALPEGVYVPRRQYFLVGLSPLIILTLFGTLLIPILPLVAIPTLVLTLILNASGSVGDVLIMGWLLRQPPEVLIEDTGTVVMSYGPTDSAR